MIELHIFKADVQLYILQYYVSKLQCVLRIYYAKLQMFHIDMCIIVVILSYYRDN